MIRVLATSSGVVKPAAMPPATAPHKATVKGVDSIPVTSVQCSLKYSQSGNCIKLNGISRITVVP